LNLILIIVVFMATISQCANVIKRPHDKYSEDLLLQILPDGLINAVFVFNTTGSSQSTYHTALSQVLADIMNVYGVKEFRVSLTHGRWRTDAWGYGPFSTEAPAGAELVFSLFLDSELKKSGMVGTLPERITGVRRAISTMLCSSIDSMGTGAASGNATHFRGYLPLEAVCTENLSPWIQLLPCRDRAGIGALLNPNRLYGLPYHSMAMRVSQTLDGNVTVMQTLAIVARREEDQFKLGEIFALAHSDYESRTPIRLGACPVADHSRVTVVLPPGASPDSVSPSEDACGGARVLLPNGAGVQYTLPIIGDCAEGCSTEGFEISFDAKKLVEKAAVASKDRAPLVTAHRFLTGYGQVSGGLILEVRSNAVKTPINVRVTQELPCYIRPYFASLKATINGKEVVGNDTVFTTVNYKDAQNPLHERVNGAMVTEAKLSPGAVLRVDLYFEMVLLPLNEQPPEAERGRDLPAAIVEVIMEECDETIDALGPFVPARTTVLPNGKRALLHTQYTEGLLVMTPWPDFSMPYNVVCMTLTIFGLFFGWIIVKLLRHLSDYYDVDTGKFREHKSPLRRIVETVIGIPLAIIKKFSDKFKDKEENDQQEDDESNDDENDEDEEDED